jgi:hypothetical protein
MKILISESQLNRVFSRDIDELDIKHKTPKGSGSFHYVYNSTQNPNRVFKIARPSDIDEWLSLFKNNPDIFPSVYRVGETKVKLQEPKNYLEFIDGEIKYVKHKVGDVVDAKYVELDKLDTVKAKNDWMQLDNAITDMTEEGWEFQDYVIHLILKFTSQGGDSDMIDAVSKNMEVEHPEMIKTLKKFIVLIKKLCQIKKRPDLHIDNFGYDKDGTLKCLDI